MMMEADVTGHVRSEEELAGWCQEGYDFRFGEMD